MKWPGLTVIISSFIMLSCSSFKKAMLKEEDSYDAIKQAVADFITKKSFVRRDSVFNVTVMNIGDQIIGISIIKEDNNVAVITEDKVNYSYRGFPNQFIETNGKLFYWIDSSAKESPELVRKLYQMGRVDTAIINQFLPVRTRDDGLKAVHYYFCKSNLTKYKRFRTKIAMGWYETPKLICGN